MLKKRSERPARRDPWERDFSDVFFQLVSNEELFGIQKPEPLQANKLHSQNSFNRGLLNLPTKQLNHVLNCGISHWLERGTKHSL